MQPDTGKPKTNYVLFVFYDLETRQKKRIEDNSYEHELNLCVFKQCCDVCINTKDIVCKKYGLRLQKVQGENVIASFMMHVLEIRKKFKEVVVIAHNGQAFDHQFILSHILKKTDLTPEIIMRGTKIILMQLKNVKFLDSLNYFPMSLSALLKAFGLKTLKKGYFPHLFNTLKNQNYVGPPPALEY
ncbi:unnamed protein product [Brassicogethes aeneus]|uniref:DNA-directed DNA polymerase n=1 Tax=Brassicogethes aeneus TaxID=1431903 RepID=A0A9P0AQI3_BRAAE|nr:unnamed protein product [Brassicogethes aeneus]